MKYNSLFLNLKTIRKQNNLTQQELAQILDVSRANYTRWELKTELIPLTKLNNLCNYFEINMDYIVGLSKNMKKMKNNNTLDKKIIGQNLKSLRKKHNLTQVELGKILSTTHSNISAYEHGKTLILTAFLIDICLNFNVSMDDICNRK